MARRALRRRRLRRARPDERNTVYLLEGKTFDDEVALERGNFAFLMGCDLDFQSEAVRREVTDWGKWYLDTTGVDGFRLDAVKHIAAWFFPEWIDAMERHAGKDLFVVGEYWTPEREALRWYLDRLGGRLSRVRGASALPFHHASRDGGHTTCVGSSRARSRAAADPDAVTFVDNHDSQPLQALESTVEPWFKPLAYALILLRREGYPCVFYPDYYGAEYEDTGPGRPAPPRDHGLAPFPHRRLPARRAGTTRTGRSTTTSITGTAWAGLASGTRSTRRPWPCS